MPVSYTAPSGISRGEQTKYRLAMSIRDCMKTTPADDITVRQIVENCGLTRQTFYRHFIDKYDLINWYFDKLLLKSFSCMGSGRTVTEGLTRKFSYIREEHLFFAAAFRSDDQNSLREHDFELILSFYRDLIRQKSGREPDRDTLFLLKMYCQGSVYMTINWLLSGMKDTPEELARLLVQAMPPALAQLFTRLSILA